MKKVSPGLLGRPHWFFKNLRGVQKARGKTPHFLHLLPAPGKVPVPTHDSAGKWVEVRVERVLCGTCVGPAHLPSHSLRPFPPVAPDACKEDWPTVQPGPQARCSATGEEEYCCLFNMDIEQGEVFGWVREVAMEYKISSIQLEVPCCVVVWVS